VCVCVCMDPTQLRPTIQQLPSIRGPNDQM